MLLTQQNIHKKLIKRLFYGWLSLSVVIGVIVFFIEVERVDDFVVNMALEESRFFISDDRNYLNIDQGKRDYLFQKSLHQIKERHFVIAEFYDKDKKKIVEVINPQSAFVETAINKNRHDLLMDDTVRYKKYYINKQLYLMVIVPLKTEGGKISGYFEGVYQVDENTMRSIKRNVAWSLGLVVLVVLATTVLIYPFIIALNKDLINLSIDLSKANIWMLKALGGAIAKRDGDTHTHNYRVTIYAIRLAEASGLNTEAIQALVKGAFLHDVGKIGISDTILLKPAGLSFEEFEVMKTHLRHGADIIGKYNWLKDALDVVNYHHEKFDGSGYMSGLKGEGIPVNARIFAIADYFDALNSRRPYKEPYSYEKTMQVLEENKGTHFDPEILDTFSKISRPLYAEINYMEDSVLEETLDRIIAKYFPDA